MDWERDTGPMTSREQAEELFDRLVNAFPAMRFSNVGKTANIYVCELQNWPYRYAERAVERLVREEQFFPVVALLIETIRAEWPYLALDRS